MGNLWTREELEEQLGAARNSIQERVGMSPHVRGHGPLQFKCGCLGWEEKGRYKLAACPMHAHLVSGNLRSS